MNLGLCASGRRGVSGLAAFALAIGLIGLGPRGAEGVDFNWNLNGGGLFNTAGNWDPVGGPPNDNLDTANFDQTATYTVTFASGQTNNFYRVRNGNVTFGLSGQTYTLTGQSLIGDIDGQTGRLTLSNGNVTGGTLSVGNSAADAGLLTVTTNAFLSTGTMNVGDSGTGTLTIQNGGDVGSGTSTVGNSTTSLGTATVTGAGSSWNASGNLIVGNNGTGTLNINSSGSVNTSTTFGLGSNPLGDGTATVSGTDSLLSAGTSFVVGGGGRGSLTISGGATAQSASTATVGSASGSSGDVTITGAGTSLFVANLLTVGGSGSGLIEVLAGAAVNSGSTTISSISSGTAVVNGLGSIWTVSGGTTLGGGVASDGFMFVTGGGAYHSTSTAFTIGSAGVGNLTVSGPGSLVSAPSAALDIGITGSGTLNISDGGVVTSSIGRLGLSAAGIGAANVTGAGSTWNSGNLTIGSGASGNAALTVGSGGTVNAGSITLVDPTGGPTATLTINTGGTVNVTSGFTRGAGALALNGGLLHVSGSTFINGSAPTQLSLSGASASDEPTLRLSNNAQTSNLAQIVVGHLAGRRAAVEVQSGADLTLSGGGISALAVGAGSTGSVLVSGAGSTLSATSQEFRVGEAGVGSLTVRDGGSATLRDVTLGLFSGANGALTVSDSGSRVDVTNLFRVGLSGAGSLIIANGGSVSVVASTSVGQGNSGVGTVLIDGAGSMLDAGGGLTLGSAGSGTMTIQNGGAFEGGDLEIGNGTGTGSGTATVSGAGAFVRARQITIGSLNNSKGTLNVLASGTVEASNGLVLNDPVNGLLTIDGGSLTVGGTFTRRGVLQFHDGTLNIGGTLDNGAVASPLVINGATAAANPTLRMVSASSSFNISDLTIGQHRAGSLFVEGGSSISATNLFLGADPGGNGQATIEGVASAAAAVAVGGDSATGGHGTLNLELGGAVVAGTTFSIFPQGTVNLNGGELQTGLFFNSGTLNFNAGTIRYSGAALLLNSSLAATLGPTRELLPGRTLRANGALTMSGDATIRGGQLLANTTYTQDAGTLRIVSGTVESQNLARITGGVLSLEGGSFTSVSNALQVDAGGEVQLHGGGSTITAPLGLSNSGLVRGSGRVNAALTNNTTGEVRIENGQRLHFASTTAQINVGLINVTGGTFEISGLLVNSLSNGLIAARDGIVRFNGGLSNNGSLTATIGVSDVYGDITNSGAARIVVSGGGHANFYDDVANSGTINVSAAGTLRSTAVFFGSLSGAGVSGAGQVFIEGDMRPGFSPGTMAFGGDLSFGPLAELEIEIGGATPGTQFDNVTVASSVFLDGTLDVSLINGFTPTLPGEQFTIVKAGTRTGEFSDVLGTPNAVLPGLQWTVSYTPTSAILSTTALPGDIDLDGDVDRRDTVLFTTNLGRTTGSIWTTGDFNNDGMTTLADLALQQANFGATFPSPSASPVVVPEPVSGLIALGMLLGLVAARRRLQQ